MSSLGVALPLSVDDRDGFRMIKDIKTLAKQNLKMLVLTIPGERVMDPNFGVGIKTYLFENFGQDTMSKIDTKIREQVKTYMPAIQLRKIAFSDTDPDNNYLGLVIMYSIPGIGTTDLLEITT
jgi:hypothetical protein|tara:strand:+ start:1262 stop:1630 length:369 start_codon:yes stop_codon:yes gene_type:complete